jgi:prepilin-type N-terminal cleavage/methylation domain-containing protein
MKKLHQLKDKGFSLIEVLFSIAILTIILGIAVPYFYDSYLREDQSVIVLSIANMLVSARHRAMNQVENSEWGIFVDQQEKKVTLFKGERSIDRDELYDESITFPRSISIDVQPYGNQDIVFRSKTGRMYHSDGNTIQIASNNVVNVIRVSEDGVVSY